jgi:putative FmdB family regulatory protein
MPLYEYECEACAQRFERIQKFSDPPVDKCPSCGASVRKLLSSPAIQFKGSGWYITDYAKKGGAAKEATDSKGKKDAAESGKAEAAPAKETSSTETKPAAPAKSE